MRTEVHPIPLLADGFGRRRLAGTVGPAEAVRCDCRHGESAAVKWEAAQVKAGTRTQERDKRYE